MRILGLVPGGLEGGSGGPGVFLWRDGGCRGMWGSMKGSQDAGGGELWMPPQPCPPPELQVKSEPGSPTPSHCSDSSGLSCGSEPPQWVRACVPPLPTPSSSIPPPPLLLPPLSAQSPQAPSPPEPVVKTEPPPLLSCAPADAGELKTDRQTRGTDRQMWGGVPAACPPPRPPLLCCTAKAPRAMKAEGTPPSRRTPPIQPKPPGGASGAGGTTPSPPQTILLQPLPGPPPSLPTTAITGRAGGGLGGGMGGREGVGRDSEGGLRP